jgi:hypothetical protein
MYMDKINKYLKSHKLKLSCALAGVIFIFVYTFTPVLSGVYVLNMLKLTPNPNFFIISNQRQTSINHIHAAFKELEAKTDYAKFVESQGDSCSQGHHNYERNDSFSNICTVRATKFYGFSGDFKHQLLELDNKLTSLGWKDQYDSIDTDITYYDRYIGTVESVPDSFTAKTGIKAFRDTVDELPDGQYITDKKQGVSLEYAEANTALDKMRRNFDHVQKGYDNLTYEKNNAVSTDVIINQAMGKADYILSVTISEDYFIN